MRNRENWWWSGILMLEVMVMPNPWMAAILASIILGTFQIGRSWFILRTLVIPIAGLAGAYIALVPLLKLWMVVPILWAGTFVGVALGLWGLLGLYWSHRPWQVELPKGWWGYWGVYEHGTGTYQHLCGHGNTMHLVSVASLSLASAVGLGIAGQWLAWLAVPFCLVPIGTTIYYQSNRKHPGQWALNLLTLLVGVLVLYWPIVGLTIFGLGIVVAVAVLSIEKPWNQSCSWWDSGRFPYWRDVLWLVWWPEGWKRRLFGFGSGSWFVATIRMATERGHPAVFTMAHNEYMQQLIEHGILGLVAMLGYLGDSLWRSWHGGAEGHAVFLVGLVWCAVALVNFPTSFYHEYHPRTVQEEQWFGSPTLNAWSFVLAVLIEVFH